jgi:hypothetical protein
LSNPQKPNISISEKLAYTTVRIEALLKNNPKPISGTGFWYLFVIDGKEIPVIVTNKHMTKNTSSGFITISKSDSNMNRTSEKLSFEIKHFENACVNHPDPSIDLSIIPIAGLIDQLHGKNFDPHFSLLDKSIIPSQDQLQEFTNLEDIIMIGYPDGLWDSENNLPIFRRGITATSIKKDYNGKKEFLIDAAVFPGSSGSPVFVFNEGSYSVPSGLAIGTRIRLVGILYAVHQHRTDGKIITTEIPTKTEYSTRSFIPNNLGVVIRSNLLLDFEPIIKTRL